MSLCVSAPAAAAPAAGLASRLRRLLLAQRIERPGAASAEDDAPFVVARAQAPTSQGPRRRSALGQTNVLLL
ncbi:hypothetical protein [Aureimonas sp. AU4]|uniref:hypothetical protein n=1 Tax=Aureimonas sp. AU4 TaxID=1638163 RepID=UPI000780E320|nr:hypothetical protein [Aureimonas sp. AU4]